MKDLNKQYINTFNKIDLNNEKSIRFKANIKNHYKKVQKRNKIVFSISIIFIIMIISISVPYADEIKKTFNGLAIKIGIIKNDDGSNNNFLKIEADGIKEINYDADLVEEVCNELYEEKCEHIYTLKELEDKLEIKLLKSDLFKRDVFSVWSISRNEENKIMNLRLSMFNAFDIHPNYKGYYKIEPVEEGMSPWMSINYDIFIKTKYYTGENKDVWRQTGWLGDDIKEYYIKDLDTTAIGLCFGSNRWIFFEYDNVVYHFRINVIGKRSPDEDIETFLNTLHY